MTASCNGKSPTILLVDDIPSNLRVLYESLTGRSYRLLIANGGAQAIDVARRSSPDLILLDVMMPEVDGFEVCRRLKADPATAKVAVIFLSALDEAADKVKGLKLGAVDYITKPFHPDEVAARVETHCKILRLERELAHRHRQLELVRDRILESMVEGVIGTDSAGRVRFANAAAQRMCAFNGDDVGGRDLTRAEPEGLADGIRQVLDGTSGQLLLDLELSRPGGSAIPAEAHIAPVHDQDTIDGAVLVLRDLSERRRAEAELNRAHSELLKSHEELRSAQMRLIQAAKLESVGRLAAGVAHEVKNPLAIIQLGVDFLQQTLALDEVSSEVLSDMVEAVSRADTVVRSLLDFSRERMLTLSPAAIGDIINSSLKLVRHEMSQRHIELITDMAEDIPEIPLDTDKLQQVFLNLLMNAVQAMNRDGKLRVTTAFTALTDDDIMDHAKSQRFHVGERAIRVRVEDTGPGISNQHLERLFDPFFTTKPTGQGTGLGLSVSRNIVKLHGGSIDIGNRPEGGAVAILLFDPAGASTRPADGEGNGDKSSGDRAQ